MEPYRRHYRVQWADLDANGHVANTAFLDYATETRLSCFAERGFTARDFVAADFGPVVLRDVVHYYKELRFQEEFSVTFQLAGFSEDRRRMRVYNEFFRHDGALAATICSDGVWFDLGERRPRRPPDALIHLLETMERTDDFELLTGPPR